jgi:uncharacterized protein (UPF0332 family)
MKGEDFLEIAKALLRMKSEAAWRSAIGRAYYALINAAAQLFREWGIAVAQGPSVHGDIQNSFSNCGVERAADIARVLSELRTKRNQADYDMASKGFDDQNFCALLVAKAETTIKTLTTFKQEPLRTQIQTGIRAYESKIKYS